MCPVYLGLARILATVTCDQPAPSGEGAPAASSRPAMALADSRSRTRQSNIWVTHGPRSGSALSRVRVRPCAARTGTARVTRSGRYP